MYVFFFKQKSAYDVRISDWSSDVCSSDLAEQQYALAAVELRVDLRDVVHGDVEALDLAAEQEHPVEDGRGEGVDVARDVAQRRRPAEDAGQAGARIAALVGAAQQEVGRDRVQEQPRPCPSAVTDLKRKSTRLNSSH